MTSSSLLLFFNQHEWTWGEKKSKHWRWWISILHIWNLVALLVLPSPFSAYSNNTVRLYISQTLFNCIIFGMMIRDEKWKYFVTLQNFQIFVLDCFSFYFPPLHFNTNICTCYSLHVHFQTYYFRLKGVYSSCKLTSLSRTKWISILCNIIIS